MPAWTVDSEYAWVQGPSRIFTHTTYRDAANTGVIIDGVMLTIDNIENTAGDTVGSSTVHCDGEVQTMSGSRIIHVVDIFPVYGVDHDASRMLRVTV